MRFLFAGDAAVLHILQCANHGTHWNFVLSTDTEIDAAALLRNNKVTSKGESMILIVRAFLHSISMGNSFYSIS